MKKQKSRVIELIPQWPQVRCDDCHRISTIEQKTEMNPWSCPYCKNDHFSTSMRF